VRIASTSTCAVSMSWLTGTVPSVRLRRGGPATGLQIIGPGFEEALI
jgi:hypothetical protein